MTRISTSDITLLVVALALGVGGHLLRHFGRRNLYRHADSKLWKMLPKLGWGLFIVGIWLFTSQLLPILFGAPSSEGVSVQIAPERRMVLGMSISDTVIVSWCAMAVVLIAALVVRLTVIPHMQMRPRGIQNVLEAMVDGINTYVDGKVHGAGDGLPSYLFALAAMMVASAAVELLGVRGPTSDITMTAALALITFFMVNYYGIKRKGVLGRLKALNAQGPVVMVLRVISDCAVPVSMACRLFGNMLGGMVVMDLLYSALGSRSLGIPSVLGLYFNVFHPLIQTFIFVTLTLAFINEAIE